MARTLRADAVRNRDKLLAAAASEFAAQGLDAPLEHIARRAGVSIGTLYNHFPTRDDFLDALLPERLGPAMAEIAARALAEDDPWRSFETYLVGLLELQARDRGLNDAISQRVPLSPEVHAVCARGFEQALLIIGRARDAGCLRPDYEPADLLSLTWATAAVIQRNPQGWRRFLDHYLNGVRVGPR